MVRRGRLGFSAMGGPNFMRGWARIAPRYDAALASRPMKKIEIVRGSVSTGAKVNRHINQPIVN
jgi:hypothetical protein